MTVLVKPIDIRKSGLGGKWEYILATTTSQVRTGVGNAVGIEVLY